MKKIKMYYVVEKQLDDIDGIGTTNGLKNITIYIIKNNIPKIIGNITCKSNSDGNYFYSTEEEISDFIDEFVPEYDTDKIEFIQL